MRVKRQKIYNIFDFIKIILNFIYKEIFFNFIYDKIIYNFKILFMNKLYKFFNFIFFI